MARALAPFINKTLDEHLATRLDSLNTKVNELEAANMDLKQEVTKQRQRIDKLEVLLIVLAVLLPIFQLNQLVGR